MAIDTAWGAGPKSVPTEGNYSSTKVSFLPSAKPPPAMQEQTDATLEKMRLENELLKAQLQQLQLQLEQMRKQMGGA